MYSVLDLQKLVQMLSFLGISPGSAAPAHSVVLGGGTNAAPGAAGTLLGSNGATVDPSFQTLAALGIQAALGYTPAHAGANADITSMSALTTVNGSGAALTLIVDDHTNGNGANIKLLGNGATTPSKSIRAAGGVFQVINDAYTAALLTVTDPGGAMTISSGAVGVVVGSIAALRAVLKNGSQNVFVTGYYAPGDGGGGQYFFAAGDTTSADNGGTIIVASDGGRWYLDYTDFVTTKQFGCKADGVTDDTAALQKAFTAVSNLHISIGKHLVSAAVAIAKSNFTLSGAGQDSQILTNSTTADVLDFGDGTNEYQNIVLRDFSIDATVSKTAGISIAMQKCVRTRIKNVFMSPPESATNPPRLFWGIYCVQFDYTVIEGCTVICNTAGIIAAGNASETYGAGFYITGGTKVNCITSGSVGVWIAGGCGGVVFGDCDIIGNGNNVIIDQTLAASANREIFFEPGCTLDSGGFNNLWIKANGASTVMITGTWCASAGLSTPSGVGMQVDSPNSTLTLQCTNMKLFNNAGGGATINAGGFLFNDGYVSSNGLAAGGGQGIFLANSAIGEATLTGNTIINNGIVTNGNGLLIAAGVANTNIQCNTIRNNAQSQLTDSSGAVNKLIQNNLLT